MTPTQFPIVEGEAHLWAVQPSAEDVKFLTKAEINEWRSMDVSNQELFAASRGGVRKLIAIYNKAVHAGSILRKKRGKPYLLDGPEFNVSHTAGRVFLVVSSREVGLDVEARDRRPPSEDLCRKYFSPLELTALVHSPACSQLAIRLWVCKEAIVKLAGDGIAHGLRQAMVNIDGDTILSASYGDRQVHLVELSPLPGLIAVVASWQRLDVKCFFPS